MASSIYDFEVTAIDGRPRSLAEYRGQVLLIVNVASQCGFTPQYEGLEALQQKFHARGFNVLGFPCDQFGHQEPGSDAEIASFCSRTFGVTFPMFAKVDVNGPQAHPLFRFLTAARPGLLGSRTIKWNFTKFLIDRSGNVVKRFATLTKPEQIERRVLALLPPEVVTR